MKTKLTLSIEPDVVEAGKKLAKEMKTSISALIEEYLRKITLGKEEKYKASNFLKQIPAKEPSYPYDNKSDDQWLEENLES